MIEEADIPDVLEDFRATFTEFADVDDAVVTRFLTEALSVHAIRKRVVQYIAAHFITLSRNAAQGLGPLRSASSEKVGPMQVSYQRQVNSGDARVSLEATHYGQQALLLESRTPQYRMAAFVV